MNDTVMGESPNFPPGFEYYSPVNPPKKTTIVLSGDTVDAMRNFIEEMKMIDLSDHIVLRDIWRNEGYDV